MGDTLAISALSQSFARDFTINLDSQDLTNCLMRLMHNSDNPSSWMEDTRTLGDLFFGELETALAQCDRLEIMPTGLLWNVPFQALAIGERFLCDTHTIRLLWPNRRVESSTREPSTQATGSGLLLTAVRDEQGRQLDFIKEENRVIKKYMPTLKTIHLDKSSKRKLIGHLKSARFLLHVAGHFNFSAGMPRFSYFQLSDGERLFMHDIAVLDLSAIDLVFLSACSGSLTDLSEPGFESLAHLFLSAGVGAVIASPFEVVDRDAALLASKFYEFYADELPNNTPEMALQSAQQVMARNFDASLKTTQSVRGIGGTAPTASALAWAGFAVYGRTDRETIGH